jgi:hypothetical protein
MSKRPIPILMYHSIEAMPKSTKCEAYMFLLNVLSFKCGFLKLLGYKGLSMRELSPI